jgi:NADH-quinone oxidoreductase subunit G
MPTFKLDDREIAFEPGDTIIQAAARAGIEIPHYCWHPGLSVAANCRMCLVELLPPPGRQPLLLDVLRWDPETETYVPEKKPKLVPACQQPLADGMVVKSDTSEHVLRARSAVQEFLLLNHPVDCPICDQAGECRLQDYWLEHQASAKRMRDEIVHKPKAVVFGPTIVYDAERCILCTRCVRFCEEVAKDPVLSKRERGNLSEIVLAPGRQLDHPYSLMTEFVCPVGALTAVDFRFKARVWFLRSARTVCQGCATGCNAYLDYDPRSQKVYRYRPRENLAVNQYWMCDEGMLSCRRAYERRVRRARVKGKRRSMQQGIAAAASQLRHVTPDQLGVVLSAQHSQEDNYALLLLARALGVKTFYITGRAEGEGDAILRDPDKNPNTAGVEQLCGDNEPAAFSELVQAVEQRRLSHVLALGGDVPEPERVAGFDTLEALVVLAVHKAPLLKHATVVLPAASWAEGDGTFVNCRGMAQLSERAVMPQGDSRPAWQIICALARSLGHDLGIGRLEQIRSALELPAAPSQDGAQAARAEAGAVR